MLQIDGQAYAYETAGLFLSDDPWLHPHRIIETHELICMAEGTAHLYEEDVRYVLRTGDALLLRPGVPHGGTEENRGRTSFYWAHFRIERLETLAVRPGLCAGQGYRFFEGFQRLLHVANTPDAPAYAADAAMLALLSELSMAQREAAVARRKLIGDAVEWIRIHSDRRLTVAEVAARFGYHPDALSALFRVNLRVGLKEIINRERMRRVKHLLLTTNLSVKQVADQLGWDNENQFIHYFRYHQGVGPARFRDAFFHTHLNRK